MRCSATAAPRILCGEAVLDNPAPRALCVVLCGDEDVAGED